VRKRAACTDERRDSRLTERRFLSDAAHELRTPLTVLRTGLEIALYRQREPRELQQALRSALSEVVALCMTADDLPALARLSEEAFEQGVAADLGGLVPEVAEAVEPLIQAKHLTLNTDGNAELLVRGNRKPSEADGDQSARQRYQIHTGGRTLRGKPLSARTIARYLASVTAVRASRRPIFH